MAKPATKQTADAAAPVRDGLANVISGLGILGNDKAASNFFFAREIPAKELDAIYRGTFIGRKIVDIPAEDMTREWRRWQATKDQIAAIEAEEKRLGLQSTLCEALRWSRLYGGAGIIIGDGAADPREPLDPTKIGKGGLRYLRWVAKGHLTAGEQESDIESPWYGGPRYWTLTAKTGVSMQLHPSRVVAFIGAPRPPMMIAFDGWGDSVLQSAIDSISNAASASTVIAALLQEAKTDVVMIPDLADAVSTAEGEARLIRRFQMAKMAKSVVNTLILGAGEEYDQKTINFAGLPDIHIRFLQEAAGAADMPVTRMLGQSPAGLNSTGEADLRNWYDKIAKDQVTHLRPALDRIDDVMLRSIFGSKPDDVFYTFPPLWQLTPETAAEVAVKKSAVFTADVNAGLIPAEVLAIGRQNQLIEDGIYPGLEVALDEYEAELGEGEDDDLTPNPTQTTDPVRTADPTLEPPLRIVASRDGVIADATPRSLYVRRDVLNWEEIDAWAKRQGFPTTVGAAMHVTIMFSRGAVDWMKIGSNDYDGDDKGRLTIKPGGVRLVERLGKAAALLFTSSSLSWRHESMRYVEGVEWEWPDYQPHITLSWEAPGDLDLRAMEPYRGVIQLGPEIFEEVEEGWAAAIVEDSGSGLSIQAL